MPLTCEACGSELDGSTVAPAHPLVLNPQLYDEEGLVACDYAPCIATVRRDNDLRD